MNLRKDHSNIILNSDVLFSDHKIWCNAFPRLEPQASIVPVRVQDVRSLWHSSKRVRLAVDDRLQIDFSEVKRHRVWHNKGSYLMKIVNYRLGGGYLGFSYDEDRSEMRKLI